ncbi:MAG: TonB-dependent receptor [Chitinivibrionales bacterium]|nr:TonB-dependent receptor [Chitinivibrionales bacterium]MBD3395537.1 TonB-dependent receptor [Chitinivibrionales bacterium]
MSILCRVRFARAASAAVCITWCHWIAAHADTATAPQFPDTVVELERMVVQARRAARDRSGVTRLRAEEFAGRFADLPAVLEQVSGVTVRRTGAFGEYADASIRGSSPRQVQVYLDGIPLNVAAGGAVDLSKLSLNSLREVTVYKGAAPLDLMQNSAGGVIRLESQPGKDIVSGIAEAGSFGYRKAGMLARKRSGRMANHFSVDYTGARNDYEFEFDNNTAHNPDDDSREVKHNNAYSLLAATYAASWAVGGIDTLTSLVSFGRERKEFFHKYLADTLQETERTADNVRGYARWERNLSGRGYVGVRLDGRFESRLFRDPLGLYYPGGERKERERLPYTSLRVDGLWLLTDVVSARALARGTYEGYRSENLLAASAQDAPSALRLAGTGAVEIAASWEVLRVAARYSHIHSRDSANFSPDRGGGEPRKYSGHFPNGNLDIVAHVRPWLALDCAVRHEHFPISLTDRYGWGNSYRGNADLRPEKNTQAGMGATLALKALETSFAGFAGYTEDLIELRAQSQQVMMAQNTGYMRFAGAEWDTRLGIGPFVAVDNHFTFVYKLKRTRGQEWEDAVDILYYSPIEDDLGVTVAAGPLTAGHHARYRSPYLKGYSKPEDIVAPLPALDAYVSVRFFNEVTVTYRIENYLDESVEPLAGYTPLPGRMHFLVGQVVF